MREARARESRCALVPAYAEESRIGAVVTEVREYLPDVVVVDDGSPDRTVDRAREAGAVVIRHPVNRGKGAALNTGFRYVREAGFDYVITLDADGQHDPSEIPVFIEAYVRTGIPVLIGNRMAHPADMPPVRRWTNRLMSAILSRRMGQYVPDTQCGYRLYRADIVMFIAAESARYAAESEILLNASARGVRIDSVPVTSIYGGERSTINPWLDAWRFLRMLWRYQRRKHRA